MDCAECGGRTGSPRTVCLSCATVEADKALELFRLHLLSCRTCVQDVVKVVLGATAPRTIDNLLTCPRGRHLQRDARDWRFCAGLIRRGA